MLNFFIFLNMSILIYKISQDFGLRVRNIRNKFLKSSVISFFYIYLSFSIININNYNLNINFFLYLSKCMDSSSLVSLCKMETLKRENNGLGRPLI
jgi:hypothetical protein